MADKFKRTFPVDISFVDGEIPSAAKLNALSNGVKAALSVIENFLGDGWDDSYPYFNSSDTLSPATKTKYNVALGSDKKLEITNLSRLIGPSSALNPKHLSEVSDSEREVTETLPTNLTSFNLRFSPVDSTSLSFSGAGATFTTRKSTIASLLVAGDYYVDESTGEILTISAMAGGTITYKTAATFDAFAAYPGATFNVIPDPAQSTKCTATGPSGGLYTISLPLITHQESNEGENLTILTSNSLNYNVQLKLPEVLYHLNSGDIIPNGFLYLRDDNTNEVFRTATYYYSSETEFKIGGKEIDTSHSFSVLTNGTNITQSIQNLQSKLFRLRRGLDTDYAIKIDNVTGRVGPRRNSAIGSNAEVYVLSEAPNNHFPQYLHRDGWFGSAYDDNNINDSNGMRGDIVLLSSSRVANSRNNLSADSAKIRFGHGTDGPSIGFEESGATDNLVYRGNTISGFHDFQDSAVKGSEGFCIDETSNTGPLKWYIYNGSATVSAGYILVSIPALNLKTVLGMVGGIEVSASSWEGAGSNNDLTPVAQGKNYIWGGSDFGFQVGTSITGIYNIRLVIWYMD